MQIEHIDLKNFKSYKDQSVQDISKGINIFIGKNGHGKSNLFSSLEYLFTDKAHISKRENYYHKSAAQQGKNEPIQVSVQFSNPEDDENIPQNLKDFTFKREWTADNNDYHYIKDSKASKSKVENALNIIGISKQNAYNIVQQGSIRQVQRLDEQGIYGLLEEVTGVKQFLKKEQETHAVLKNIKKEKEDLQEIFEEIENKINDLEVKQSDYKQYEENRNHVKVLKYLLIEEQIKILKKKLKEKENLIENINKKGQNNLGNNDDQDNALSLAKQKLKSKNTELQNLKLIQRQLEIQISEKQDKIKDIKQQSTQQPGETQDTQPTQNDMEIEQNQNLQNQIQQQELIKQQIDQKLIELNDQYQNLDQDINPLLTKKSMNKNNYSSKDERDQKLKQEIKIIQEAMQKKTQDLQTYKNTLQESQEICQKIAEDYKIESDKVKELQQTSKNLNDQINQINKQLQDQRHKAIEQMQINHSNQEKQDDIEQQMYQKQKIIESITRQNVIQAMNNLERELMKRGQISLILGKLADFLSIDNRKFEYLKNPIDMAYKNKLFTFIVKSNEDAQTLINVNKEINNSSIQIYSIEQIRKKIQSNKQIRYPDTRSIVVLQNEVDAKIPSYDKECKMQSKRAQTQREYLGDIKNWLKFLLQKFILVDKYEDATEYSSQYQVTSITKDLDIVYSDSFLSKIGTTFMKHNKIEVYQDYKNLMDQYMYHMRINSQYKKVKQDLENEENTFKLQQGKKMIEYKKNSQQIEEINQQLRQIELQKNNADQKRDNIQSIVQKFEAFINKYQSSLKSLQEQLNSQFDPRGQLSTQDEQKIKQLQQQIQQIKSEIQKEMSKKRENVNKLNELKSQQSKQQSTNTVKNLDDTAKLEIKILKHEIQANQKDYEDNEPKIQKAQQESKALQLEFQKQLEIARKQKDNSYNNKEQVEDDVNTEIIKKQEIENQLDERIQEQQILGDIKSFQSEIYQNLEHLSIKEIRQQLKEKTEKDKHRYTAKDQTTFNSLGRLKDKYEEFSKRKQVLNQDYQNLKKLLKNNKKQCEQAVQKVFPNFKKYFMSYFRKIVPQGKVEIIKSHFQRQETQNTQHMKNRKSETSNNDDQNSSDSENSENSTLFRKQNQSRQGIKIRLSFDDSPVQEWHALSDGQKTVVSIVLLFSLQKIDPAPFYIFDEIDAALDTNYREKIIQIIAENSQNAQYLISTFKSEWSKLKDAKFFQIYSENNVSNVKIINQKTAEQVLQQTEEEQEQLQENGDNEDY